MISEVLDCRICGSKVGHCFDGKALKRYPFTMLSCSSCGFLYIDKPFWLEEAYADAISDLDTGLVSRNIQLSNSLRPLLYYLFGENGSFVDIAGGTGLLVRLMRDAGLDFYWHDEFCKNIHARGFEFIAGIKQYQAITAFEVFEHLVDPAAFLTKTLSSTHAEVIIFTTELLSNPVPKPDEWWYYSFETGQHISFYQEKSLQKLAERMNLQFITDGYMHFFCREHYLDAINKYLNSTILKKIMQYKANRTLESKTMADRSYLLGS